MKIIEGTKKCFCEEVVVNLTLSEGIFLFILINQKIQCKRYLIELLQNNVFNLSTY